MLDYTSFVQQDTRMKEILDAVRSKLANAGEAPDGNKFAVKARIPEYLFYDLNDKDKLERHVYDVVFGMYHQLTERVSTLFAGDNWLAVRYRPLVLDRSYKDFGLEIMLVAEITAIQSDRIRIPEYIYEAVPSYTTTIPQPIEWRCGYCECVNQMPERECEKCGAPRPLLIQEMI